MEGWHDIIELDRFIMQNTDVHHSVYSDTYETGHLKSSADAQLTVNITHKAPESRYSHLEMETA